MLLLARDGVDQRLRGVFSVTDEILDPSHRSRIPEAIPGTGPRVNTWPSTFCLFGQCTDLGGDDIAHDSR